MCLYCLYGIKSQEPFRLNNLGPLLERWSYVFCHCTYLIAASVCCFALVWLSSLSVALGLARPRSLPQSLLHIFVSLKRLGAFRSEATPHRICASSQHSQNLPSSCSSQECFPTERQQLRVRWIQAIRSTSKKGSGSGIFSSLFTVQESKKRLPVVAHSALSDLSSTFSPCRPLASWSQIGLDLSYDDNLSERRIQIWVWFLTTSFLLHSLFVDRF